MKKSITIILTIIIASCNQQRVDTKLEGERLMQLSKEWSQAASSRNVDKTVSYWSDDAVLMSGGQPLLKGKDAIKKMVEESFKVPNFQISWQPQSVVVSESGDMAYMIEDSQISFPDSTGKISIEKNKAVTIWRRQQDGSWKNVVDISTPESSQTK